MTIGYTGDFYQNGEASLIELTHGLSINEGDLVVIYGNVNSTPSLTPSETWDGELVDIPSGETAKHAFYHKIAGASEPATYTFTLGSSDLYSFGVKVFTSDNPLVIDAAIVSDIFTTNAVNVSCSAIDGEVISDNALSIAMGGKDNRGDTAEAYTVADNSYVEVIGNVLKQMSAISHRVYTTGETFSGHVTMETADGNDNENDYAYSMHVSFVEEASAGTNLTAGSLMMTGMGI